MKKSLKTVAVATVVGSLALNLSTIDAQTWVQRSVSEVQSAIANTDGVYVIQWGDTLSTIAQATGHSVEALASLNSIADVDFIAAGAVLYFDEANHTVTYVDPTASITAEVALTETTEAETTVAEWVAPVTEEVTEWVAPVTEEVTEWVAPVTEVPVVTETEAVTEWVAPVTEEVTEVPVETEAVTEAPVVTEEVTEAPVVTEEVTQVPVETEAVTEAPVVTEEVTQAPVVPSANMSATEAFSLITSEKGLTATEIDQWSYIITRESGWNTTIANPSSGAYGLPQALPGNKMASHGADWATNPYTQLSWMYDYMIGRYGSIAGAYNFWLNNHWY